MARLLIFFFALIAMAIYLKYFAKSLSSARPSKMNLSKKKRLPKKTSNAADELWGQVYDTDSIEDARKVQQKFMHLGINCFVYTQGKKDVYGEVLKHYGVSVPQEAVEKAQAILAEITL